jgi:hypothetical protein
MPDQESSQVRSAQSERSYDGRGRPTKPTAARRSWPRWSSTRYSIIWSALASTDCGTVSPSALAVLRLITNSNFVACSTGRSAGFCALEDLVNDAGGATEVVSHVYSASTARLGPLERHVGQPSASHSITLVARNRNSSESLIPSASAVLRLTTSSNFVGCSIGRSPGLAPLRILSTYVAARR